MQTTIEDRSVSHGNTSYETHPSTSAADDIPTGTIHEEDVGSFDCDEIHSVTDINEETDEDVGSDADYWVVETAEPEQPENPISEGIDFVDFPHVFEQIKNLRKHSTTGCGIEDFDIVRCEQIGLEKAYYVEQRWARSLTRKLGVLPLSSALSGIPRDANREDAGTASRSWQPS